MCSPLLNKYSSVILCVRVRSQREREREREREVAKKSMCGYSRKCLSLKCLHELRLLPLSERGSARSANNVSTTEAFPIFFFFRRLFAPKVATSRTPHKYSNREQESVSSTPQNSKQTRFSLSLSLSLSLRSNQKQRRKKAPDGVVFFALLLLLFRARRREFKTRLEKRKRRKKKREEGEDDDYSTECDDEGREQQRGGEKDIRLGPTLG